jgi:hypothetical protein
LILVVSRALGFFDPSDSRIKVFRKHQPGPSTIGRKPRTGPRADENANAAGQVYIASSRHTA